MMSLLAFKTNPRPSSHPFWSLFGWLSTHHGPIYGSFFNQEMGIFLHKTVYLISLKNEDYKCKSFKNWLWDMLHIFLLSYRHLKNVLHILCHFKESFSHCLWIIGILSAKVHCLSESILFKSQFSRMIWNSI